MLGEHHHLANEFPEFRDRIHELKLSDAHFAKLYEEYEELDKEIIRIEEEIETPSDAYTEELKKKRLLLKDELFSILKKS
ncbi:MAG: DUF465 domain-containing protein [Granulosicoccaceae bacterium]|jgi:uncharacterized protein YdcH (DUF465 family)